MNQTLPKQFTRIDGVPVVVHSILAFLEFDPDIKIVLVLPESHFDSWAEIKTEFLPDTAIQTVAGGASRYQSVKNGLDQVAEGLVAIHDAVRPCVSGEIISNSFLSADKTGSGIVCVALKDSIREVSATGTKAVDRSRYQVVQTPQTFQVDKIKKAFEGSEQSFYTDDASVYEHVLREEVTLVEGDYKNLKITTQEDLDVAALFLRAKKNSR
jgi:2-C-methyl-D-erythritol 4-phosphate cytidylyltransferase